jgi:hypothetical protein
VRRMASPMSGAIAEMRREIELRDRVLEAQ